MRIERAAIHGGYRANDTEPGGTMPGSVWNK